MKFVYTFINSFLRTLARILCYTAIGGLLAYIVVKMGFKLPLFTLQTYALSDEYTFNGSKIGGLGYATADNNLRIEANQYNTISMNLILNYYHYYGEVESPIKSSDTTNILFVSCIHKDAIIDGVFSSKNNYLDLSYVSDEKCTFNWENTPTDGRLQYTFARLKYSTSGFDQIDSESGTIYNWFYIFNTQSFGIQGLNFASSLYFTDIRFYTSSDYNNLLSQYRILKGQKNAIDSVDDIKDSIMDNSAPNTDALKNSSGWLPAGPLDSLINLPLSLLNNLTTNMSKSCQPVNLPLPFLDETLTLPCINTLYSQIDGLSVWINSVSVIAAAFILFHYLMGLYNWVDDTLTFRENNYIDNWTGV